MPDLRKTRKDLTIALAAMAVIDVLAAALYFSPLIGSAESRHTEVSRLQGELVLKTQQVAPLKDLPEKVKLASRQINQFENRFFKQNSDIVVEVGKLAGASGVRIEQERYKPGDTVTEGLEPIEIDYELSGPYTSLARFINGIERDEKFFIIDSVTLGGEPQGPVKLGVKLQTFLNVGSQ